MSLYVISYDISETRIRNKVSKILEGFGRRIQYSVFECNLEEKVFNRLYKQLLEQTIDSDSDSIRIYRLCKKCAEESVTIGTVKGRNVRKESNVIVV